MNLFVGVVLTPETTERVEHSVGLALALAAPHGAIYVAIEILLFASVRAFYRELRRELPF